MSEMLRFIKGKLPVLLMMGAGYALTRWMQSDRQGPMGGHVDPQPGRLRRADPAAPESRPAAMANSQSAGNGRTVRPAGRETMKAPPSDWDKVDEASDESFPASDSAAKY